MSSFDLSGLADSAALPPELKRGFASDNHSGVHPEVLEAMAAANVGHAVAYGGDPWTARFFELGRRLFGPEAESYPVFIGTAANVISLQASLPRWGAVVCASSAHINTSEGGAPEKVGGLKLLGVATPDGKLTPDLVAGQMGGLGNVQQAQPLAVSITQSTEIGTCYTPDEIRAIADYAHSRGMVLHMDGSRLGGAAAFLGCSFAQITSDVGVDVLSLGGTKNGLMGAEAVVAIRPSALPGLPFVRKLNMQLASKMRFVSAQLLALYEGDLWLRSASHANAMARRLADGIAALGESGAVPGARLVQPAQSNGVFAALPAEAKARAHDAFHFYDWPGDPELVRLMCSYDTSVEDVDALLAAIAG